MTNRRLPTYPISANDNRGTGLENTQSITDAIKNTTNPVLAKNLLNAQKAPPLPFGTAPTETPSFNYSVRRSPEQEHHDNKIRELQVKDPRAAEIEMSNRRVWAAKGII